MRSHYDIIVIGAGHAGCEAAVSAARLGSSVLLMTMDFTKIAQMSCNPSIGGIAKGQIVREIDALGGFTGIVTDASTIQFRMLNRSKGPAMWSPRAQCDRMAFSMNWRYILENTPNLYMWQDVVTAFNFEGDNITSVRTSLGSEFSASAYILTAGTFLNGKIFVGQESVEGGRISEPASYFLTKQLLDRGVTTSRMKTGTPPRIDIRSVDLSKLEVQYGDAEPDKFSYLNFKSPIQAGVKQKECYIAHTNEQVHNTLKEAFHLSPLFSGKISGIGPRYCPSIEDKLRTFADKTSHQVFLEPEGWDTNEYYLQGFSSSLPYQTQIDALRQVEGFENVQIYRPAYAIEYDYFDPTQLDSSLRSKVIPNLYLAGQVNGTTGYEEAAAQGLMAGINAHRSINSLEPVILGRDTSYIGVLIDDLVTKGVDEPYRMFTSRAEYRILLRQDNADVRLTPIAKAIGLADSQRSQLFDLKQEIFSTLFKAVNTCKPAIKPINSFLENRNSAPIDNIKPLSSLLVRPQITLSELYKFVPRGTKASLTKISDRKIMLDEQDSMSYYLSLPYFPYSRGFEIEDTLGVSLLPEAIQNVEIFIKYQGYIDREIQQAQKLKNLERLSIPKDFDYSRLTSLSMEARLKLQKHQPMNIAQASRIPGVSPSDISVLLVYFGR